MPTPVDRVGMAIGDLRRSSGGFAVAGNVQVMVGGR